jgi:hypothetical protein
VTRGLKVISETPGHRGTRVQEVRWGLLEILALKVTSDHKGPKVILARKGPKVRPGFKD